MKFIFFVEGVTLLHIVVVVGVVGGGDGGRIVLVEELQARERESRKHKEQEQPNQRQFFQKIISSIFPSFGGFFRQSSGLFLHFSERTS